MRIDWKAVVVMCADWGDSVIIYANWDILGRLVERQIQFIFQTILIRDGRTLAASDRIDEWKILTRRPV